MKASSESFSKLFHGDYGEDDDDDVETNFLPVRLFTPPGSFQRIPIRGTVYFCTTVRISVDLFQRNILICHRTKL